MTLTPEEMRNKRPVNRERVDAYKLESNMYTPTTAEVRTEYMRTHEDNDDSALAAEFDRWFLQEIEKAEYSGYLRAVREGLHR